MTFNASFNTEFNPSIDKITGFYALNPGGNRITAFYDGNESYVDNVERGTATVIVTGKGKWIGEVRIEFTIKNTW